jgi:hypothetical protein
MENPEDLPELVMSQDEFRAWVTPIFSAWCRRTKLLDVSLVEHLVSTLLTNSIPNKLSEIARQFREIGPLITPQERADLGFKGRKNFGRTYIDALTERGRQAIDYPAATLASEFSTSLSREFQRRLIISEGSPARIMIRGGAKDCAAAAQFARRTFPNQIMPNFPLAACDADHCRCSYTRPPPGEYAFAPAPSFPAGRPFNVPPRRIEKGPPVAASIPPEDKKSNTGCAVAILVALGVILLVAKLLGSHR